MMIGVAFVWSTAAGAAAVPPSTMATPSAIAKAAFAALRVCFLITPTLLCRTVTQLDTRARIRFERWNSQFQSCGCQPPLHEAERSVGGERKHRHPDRGGQDALDPIGRLVRQDVAETAASCDRGDRRGRDHEDDSRADAGE